MKGLFIPEVILKDERLNSTEKLVLSLYHYFTVNGEYHCCTLTNEQVCNELGICLVTLKKTKAALKKANLIKTNGGIKVIYTGFY